MPISFKKGLAVLRGALDIEEAERLLSALEKDPDRHVDMGELESIHTAVLQVVIAKKPTCAALPQDTDLAAILAPFIKRADGAPDPVTS